MVLQAIVGALTTTDHYAVRPSGTVLFLLPDYGLEFFRAAWGACSGRQRQLRFLWSRSVSRKASAALRYPGVGSHRCADVEPDAIIFGGDGSIKSSKECLVNRTVAAECGGLPPDAFWWLSFAAGLFEHLTADVAFPDIVEASVQLVFPDLKDSKRRQLARWFSKGSLIESFLDGRWELMRDAPRPRSLTGCDYLASYEVRVFLNADLLLSASEFSSIQFICPVSCGCSLGEMYKSSLSSDGVQFSRVDDILMVSNSADGADDEDYGMDNYFNQYYYHYEENNDNANRGFQWATDAAGGGLRGSWDMGEMGKGPHSVGADRARADFSGEALLLSRAGEASAVVRLCGRPGVASLLLPAAPPLGEGVIPLGPELEDGELRSIQLPLSRAGAHVGAIDLRYQLVAAPAALEFSTSELWGHWPAAYHAGAMSMCLGRDKTAPG
ncbi:unnamed protein product [Prorocentrum cordatum]|uniref:Uncharacterized protein n=1 Tax=Prorocentrum cordatum TaxID=2364126 RepID=A0ABN9T6G4_9DINO|nr:unnamed protein product [Polarella glacialis]